MHNRITLPEIGLVAALVAVLSVSALVVTTAPHSGGIYQLARYTGAGDRYIDDHGLTYDDCMAALEAPHVSAMRCEVER